MQATNRTVVITGASSGIGLALAAAYLERGYNVVGNARSAERLSASLGCNLPARAAYSRRMPGLCRAGRTHMGASADVHDVRARRLLRLEPASARRRTLPPHRASRHAFG